jgi:hypothetical protein
MAAGFESILTLGDKINRLAAGNDVEIPRYTITARTSLRTLSQMVSGNHE